MEYYVINFGNSNEPINVNIFDNVPFLRLCYILLRGKYSKRRGKYKFKISYEDLLEIIDTALRWQFWGRVQYEMVIKELFVKDEHAHKISVYDQLKKNVPIIVRLILSDEQKFLELVEESNR